MEEKQQAAGAEEEKEATATVSHGFPCRSCGNRMVYSPEEEALLCPFCRSTEGINAPEVEAPEYTFDPESCLSDAPNWDAEGDTVHVCPACGAETVSDMVEMTLTCPFCGSHYGTEPKTAAPILRPETMIPHKLSRERANALFAKWARKRYFAPRAFRRAAHTPEMQGVYLPYFTYDTDLKTSYSGQGGRRRLVTYTVRVNGKTQTRTRTVIDWYPVFGDRELYVDDAPFCASRNVDAKMLRRLGGYSTKVLRVYHPAYLAGFMAERYTLGLGEGFDRIRPGVEARMEGDIRSSLGYDTYRMMQYNHRFRAVRFKHILLPVWLSSYRYRGKIYRFMVNGESGRVAGQSPLSPLKIALAVLGGLACLALLIFLFALIGDSAAPLLMTPPDTLPLLPQG